jgi:transposase
MDPPLSDVALMPQTGCDILGIIPPEQASSMVQTISVLGMDIAKLVFHVVGMDDTGHEVLRKHIARSELRHVIATLPPALIGMEACGSAHDWARCVRAHAHDMQLIAPQFVKASVKSSKNDACDAELVWEAVTRPTIR